MGSQPSEEEFTVLVTGFAPFRENYPVNPSWEIASRLPAYLPPLRAKDPSRPDVALPPVRILVHPEPVRVNYQTVRALVPELWAQYNPDVCIHMGMAGARPAYQIERRGHRTGYKSRDVDGKLLDDEEGGVPRLGRDWIWYGVPDELETELDLGDVLGRWIGHSSAKETLIISEDAGRYLCDFIYFSSLAYLWKQQRPRKTVFFHVPSDASNQSVETGRELALNLIRSVVESETASRARAEVKQGGL